MYILLGVCYAFLTSLAGAKCQRMKVTMFVHKIPLGLKSELFTWQKVYI